MSRFQIQYTLVPCTLGESDGSICITEILGSNKVFTYIWDDDSTSACRTSLSAGEYSVTVTEDKTGYTQTFSFLLTTNCDNLDSTSIRTILTRVQCCSGEKLKQHQAFLASGRDDLVKSLDSDLFIIRIVLKALKCVEDPGDDPCLTCSQIHDILMLIGSICECDCCDNNEDRLVDVLYNHDLGTAQPIPDPPTQE